MPSSQFDKAFALLEQSFKDANFLQAYKALPSRQTTEKAESPTQLDFSDDDNDSDYSDSGMHQGYRPRDAPSISLMRRNSTLPPTPPTRSRNVSASHAHLIPLPGDKAGTNTPPHHQAPPTPDLTPPNTRNKELAPPRPAMPHCASSRAESFMTARETQSQASASTSQASLPLRSEPGHKWLDATRGVRLGSLHLGVADRQKQWRDSMSESGETTPTQETHRDFPAPPAISSDLVEYIDPKDLNREASTAPESDADNFLRNVTIRKKRAGDQQQTTRSQKISTSSHKRSKFVAMPLSEETNGSPSTVKDGETLGWPETANDHLYRHMRDEKSKRLSSASTTSTVVEAFVLAGPAQQKQPALRRVSRVDTLRDDTSSRRSSVESQHVIKHRVSPLPGRKHLVNGDVDGLRSASNPETGRISKVPVIVIPERRSSRSSASAGDKTHLLTFQQNRLHRPKNHVSLKQDYNKGETPRPSLNPQVDLNSDIWLDYASPDHQQDQSRTRLRHVSAPVRTDADSTETSSKDAFGRLNGQDAKFDLRPKQGWKRHSLDAELESPEVERPRKASVEQGQSIDHRLLLPSQQKHSSAQALFDYPLQSSLRKSSDTKDGRHLHSSTSPFSQLSDQTDSMELNEAKAINLYPHDNKSLLMVQHVAKKRLADAQNTNAERQIDALTTPNIEDEPTEQDSRPTFQAVIDTPTPPDMEDPHGSFVDSPLRNPRAAPQPPRLPAVIISPATPSSQFRKTPSPASPPPPQRRPSLVEKARRYSESLILPFLPSSSSRRNSVSSQRPKSSEDRDTTLHPFWRPRGFWDDFSDSEEEDFSDDELPAGGDTSEICSLESVEEQGQRRQQGWRAKRLSVRLPGFRGNGGFMLGNSLGIDRHGTNIRRHHVAHPSKPSISVTDAASTRQQKSFLTRLFAFPTLRKRKSTDMLRAAAQSTESLRRLSQRHRRRNWHWDMGLRGTMGRRRERKEEVKKEKYREGIKGRIGAPVLLR